jgi:hypothetical protein
MRAANLFCAVGATAVIVFIAWQAPKAVAAKALLDCENHATLDSRIACYRANGIQF